MTLRHPVCVSERETLKETCMFGIRSLGGLTSREHCICVSKKAKVSCVYVLVDIYFVLLDIYS